MILWTEKDDPPISRDIVQSIEIGRAVYCEDCRTVNNSYTDHCIQCGSVAIVSIERLIRRSNGYSAS